MKLRVASDLHFDHHADAGATLAKELANGDFDVLVVAGDLSDYHGFQAAASFLCAAVAPRQVLYVLGNHEGYGGQWQRARVAAGRLGQSIANLTYLERSVATIQGRRFVGCTLWYRHSGGHEPLDAVIQDFAHIHDVRQLLPRVAPASAQFLRDTVRTGDIVVTHHLPHPRSIAPEFEGSRINGYFLHDVSEVVENRGAALWVHGHTHASRDYTAGTTRVVCNPFGYARRVPGEPNREFRADLDLVV